jgi:hypothetical protein
MLAEPKPILEDSGVAAIRAPAEEGSAGYLAAVNGHLAFQWSDSVAR